MLDESRSDYKFIRWEDGKINVFIRKRPIFKKETNLGEFDVVTCNSLSSVTIHDARMHTDMKRQFINHHEFQFDRVFNENISNATVYNQSVAPLVRIASVGGFATCLMYGQTGSGECDLKHDVFACVCICVSRLNA